MSRRFALWAGLAPVLLFCTALIFAPTLSAQDENASSETPAAEVSEASETSASPAAADAAAPAKAAAEAPAEKVAEAPAEEAAEAAPAAAYGLNETEYALDNMMLFICAVLVIFMQAGFALVETGLNASKNAVNIMFKNYMDFVIGALLFFLVGYGIMYPGDEATHLIPNWLGFAQVGVPTEAPAAAAATLHPMADFMFQVAFAATAATIVSGSVAGRIKFGSYIAYTAAITGFIYPVAGMWHWGQGWLADMGFHDFAGSLVVHAVGGFAGLAGAIALGPRLGRYVNGKAVPMPGHNLPLACLGVFILMIGWYGFNPGSQLAFTGGVNVDRVVTIAVNTTLAGCAGSLAGMLFSWISYKKPDLTFALNGGLCGLVGITANCDCVTAFEALIIGGIAGVLVCLAVLALDKLQIDDPVGAFPVHGVGGIWAGVATGIFGTLPAEANLSLTTQLIGVGVYCAWALGASLALFFGLKAVGLLRVDAEEELAGLDISEHGMYAYPQQVVALESTPSASLGSYSTLSPVHAGKPSTEAV